ncbi:ABC transporter ATP-binding protein [Desulfuromonas acetoxidans]|uniref:ABC transporter related n=1 Tax=Desulfuromonas acetoxidans (strain DSM 684 / 11070) TaxID=281689 RepID=Q1K2M1_DESA6|nr:ABC transporter ATP-binding protein [Desulfuromonas acetoxidans]EAT16860.1 ABC transporter related [Desulfuromonas acetoxidans DSM 684]MBF0645490.1 ABC transporter ATP-binding protein [Desulfuromonas acetoxidans]NVD23806.1 ABC transporter ATP-binding protein [Desulfuromonas acetoxidans]NVE15797.1 ABC transporter ATP-binding protein [Desulfuromonas acetoxidans]
MAIELQAISKKFGSQELFRDLSLHVEAGTFHVLVGPSGEGKSTLLSIIAGLQKPDSGEIYLNDICVTKKQPQKRDVGFVFQDYALFPHLNALENVEYGLKASGVNRLAAFNKAQHYLALVGLLEEQHKFPAMLSGGQKQRIALARALANEPGTLLLDEPLSHVDPESRSQLQLELKELQRKTGVTMLLVTHNMTEAAVLGHKVSFLRRGAIEKTVNIKAFV